MSNYYISIKHWKTGIQKILKMRKFPDFSEDLATLLFIITILRSLIERVLFFDFKHQKERKNNCSISLAIEWLLLASVAMSKQNGV
jgi:hypothetical protein